LTETKERKILNFIKKIFSHPEETDKQPVNAEGKQDCSPVIYARSEHSVSRSQISDNALKVLYRLKKSGYESYLVGGCVRDLLLGYEPKDFDVATNASPEQIRQIFRNCRLIGRRFRLAHIYFGREIIEVATFRATDGDNLNAQAMDQSGRLLRDNVFGRIEDDVWRRDFTVNALYYNIQDFSIVDYVQGMKDHKSGILRLLGDPETRYREDPVRILRAVRFAVKLGFKLDEASEKPIFKLASLLKAVPSSRLYDETLKLFLSGKGLQTFEILRHYGLFSILFPQSDQCLNSEENDFPRLLIAKALENSDLRLAEGKTITAYFLLSALLWESVKTLSTDKMEQGETENLAYQQAAREVLSIQVKSLSIPRRVTQSMREVWLLQLRFNNRIGSKVFRFYQHPRFRAAYDFLVLRAETGDADQSPADWWTQFQQLSEAEQKKMSRPPRRQSKKKPTSVKQK